MWLSEKKENTSLYWQRFLNPNTRLLARQITSWRSELYFRSVEAGQDKLCCFALETSTKTNPMELESESMLQINQLSTRPDEWMNACSFEQMQWGLAIQRFNNPLLVCPPRWLIPWIHHKCPWKHCNCWKGWGLRGLRRFYQGWEMNQITLRMFLTNPG